MPSFKLSVWYAATGDDDPPQVHSGLSRETVEQFVRPETGFMSDMLNLEGRGVRKLMLEVTPDAHWR